MEQGEVFDGHVDAAMRGDFITAAEFNGRTPVFRIRETRRAVLERQKLGTDDSEGNTKKQERPLVYFDQVDGRAWVLNRTNAECLKALFGPVMAAWKGKRVQLCAEMVQLGPKKELGIRILGSPDIEADVKVEIKLPRRRPVERVLRALKADPAAQKE